MTINGVEDGYNSRQSELEELYNPFQGTCHGIRSACLRVAFWSDAFAALVDVLVGGRDNLYPFWHCAKRLRIHHASS